MEHLDIDFEIRPDDSYVQVEGDVTVRGLGESFSFLLNPCLEIDSIQVYRGDSLERIEAVEQRPPQDVFIPSSYYRIELPEDMQNSEELTFRFKYRGRIFRYSFNTSRIQSDYVELAIYSIWYPFCSFRDRPSFEVRLRGPANWTWIMNADKVDDNPLTWRSDDNRTDLTLHGRPINSAIHPEESELFWGSPTNLDLYKPLEAKFSEIQGQLINWLGEPETKELQIILVPRDFGGGYARHGLIVIQENTVTEIESEVSIMSYWGHEFAHSWFKRTTVEDYHNWVDEALATYASLLAIEEVYGPEAAQERIEKMRKRIEEHEELPSIKSIERSHPHAQLVYYVYGTLIMHQIREEIGKDTMIDVLHNFAQKCLEKKQIVTKDLIGSLNEMTGRHWDQHMEERLTAPPSALSSISG